MPQISVKIHMYVVIGRNNEPSLTYTSIACVLKNSAFARVLKNSAFSEVLKNCALSGILKKSALGLNTNVDSSR